MTNQTENSYKLIFTALNDFAIEHHINFKDNTDLEIITDFEIAAILSSCTKGRINDQVYGRSKLQLTLSTFTSIGFPSSFQSTNTPRILL